MGGGEGASAGGLLTVSANRWLVSSKLATADQSATQRPPTSRGFALSLDGQGVTGAAADHGGNRSKPPSPLRRRR